MSPISDVIFILLINIKMPTIVGILTFISRIKSTYESYNARFSISVFMRSWNFMLSWVEHKKNTKHVKTSGLLVSYWLHIGWLFLRGWAQTWQQRKTEPLESTTLQIKQGVSSNSPNLFSFNHFLRTKGWGPRFCSIVAQAGWYHSVSYFT